jgi:hypothetical protein
MTYNQKKELASSIYVLVLQKSKVLWGFCARAFTPSRLGNLVPYHQSTFKDQIQEHLEYTKTF